MAANLEHITVAQKQIFQANVELAEKLFQLQKDYAAKVFAAYETVLASVPKSA